MRSLEGRLLVASPQLLDPNFTRTVLLLLNHDEDGALGVVLNRPSTMSVAEVLPGWSSAVARPERLFGGGPVAGDSALAVAVPLGAGPQPSSGFQPLSHGYGLVDLDASPQDLMPDLAGVRVFAGYAGWGADQLEGEIEEGSWFVVDARPADVLTEAPERLWRDVLRRQGCPLAYVATFPDDPTMN